MMMRVVAECLLQLGQEVCLCLPSEDDKYGKNL